MSADFISDWREMYEKTLGVLNADEPVFYGRIGGSDTDMLIEYLVGHMGGERGDQLLDRVRPKIPLIEKHNGYYDKRGGEGRVLEYCDILWKSYKRAPHSTLVGEKWLTRYFKDNVNAKYWTEVGDRGAAYDFLIKSILLERGDLTLYPFTFVEKTTSHKWSMFNAFAEVLTHKRVLVISPFERTIQKNFINRQSFFKDYTYPEFELLTVAAPITYKGLPEELYPHESWFDTADALKSAVAKVDFDIALLSCGSYAMPLGVFIAETLKRKAVYVGGILQLYFGVMGRRYENPFYLDQINREAFILPEERDMYLAHVKIAPNAAKEGFAAYL